ncbi:hypothetical protein D1007_32789 [Hordeum vulgare]|nr:hypothetical protein D1007_32789 [Hordeum vulgare]
MPREEIVQEPCPCERIVFGTHFLVDFELPGSILLQQFLEFYGIQMHHLGPNSILYLTCFATLCEAYLGFLPFSSFFYHLFHFRAQTHRHGSYSCGRVVVYRRVGRLLLKIKFKESFKKWQCTFLYDLNMRSDELVVIASRMQQLMDLMGLLASDLVAAFVSHRVLPQGPELAIDDRNTPDGPNPEHVDSNREGSHAEDFEPDGDGLDGTEGSDEEDEGDEVDKPAGAAAGGARMSRHTPKGSFTGLTDNDDELQVPEEAPIMMGLPRGRAAEGARSYRLEAGSLSPSGPSPDSRRVLSRQAEAEASTLEAEQIVSLVADHMTTTWLEREHYAKGKAAPTMAAGASGPSGEVTSDAVAPMGPEAPAMGASPTRVDVHLEPPPEVMASPAGEPAAHEVARSVSDPGQRTGPRLMRLAATAQPS